MIFIISCLFTIYFEESFDSLNISQWKTEKSDNFTISECSASHPDLVHNCLYLSNPNDKLTIKSQLTKPIKKHPLLIYFTTRSTLPTSGSKISLTFGSNSQKAFSIGYNFNRYPEYFLNDADGKNLCNGSIQHDPFVSHSITMIFRDSKSYELYADGMIFGNGNLVNQFPISDIELNIETKNNTVQFGNLLITSDVRQKWPTLISTLLRFRDIERRSYIKNIVDAYENELFDGTPFKGKLDLEEEEGKLLTEEEADPRRFNFPFKINNKNEDEDPARAESKKDKNKKLEKLEEDEEYEENEDAFGSDL
ncbi:hypothetical protein M9Y10_043574 [Tritrichomonas musculus]|uniref:Uncharacterized protein n=1 Tax=Tritrichomonas musculus TaxID=1915356 RepID=A0ABR2K039_9EUKA